MPPNLIVSALACPQTKIRPAAKAARPERTARIPMLLQLSGRMDKLGRCICGGQGRCGNRKRDVASGADRCQQTGRDCMSKHVVATVAEIPPGSRKLVTVRGRSIAVFNLDGEFFGLFNRCPHQGGPMCEGILTGLIESDEPGQYRYSRKGEIIRCPWHGWEFDVRTGQSYCEPERIQVRSYPVEVAEGQRVVQGPYVAETVPVSVEQHYVVVDV